MIVNLNEFRNNKRKNIGINIVPPLNQLTLVDVVEVFHNLCMSPIKELKLILNGLEPHLPFELLDINASRGFIVETVNILRDDPKKMLEWIANQENIENNKNEKASCLSEFLPTRSKEQVMYDKIAETIATATTCDHLGCYDYLAFASSLYWAIHNDYGNNKPITLDMILQSIVEGHYDFDELFGNIEESSLKLCSAWFVGRAMGDVWHFAAIMQNGEIIPFIHINEITHDDNSELKADIDAEDQDCVNSILYNLNHYNQRMIHENVLSVRIKNIYYHTDANETVWASGELEEDDAYVSYRPKVSINMRHVIRAKPYKNGKILSFSISQLRPSSECESKEIKLKEAIMFFETTDS